MLKIIKWVLIIVLLGGVAYYLIDYNKDKPEDSDFIKSTKDFTKDAVENIKKGFDEGKKMISDSSSKDSTKMATE